MPSDVRVHTLRLHQPLPALGRNAQAWAEDALRCASLPSRWQHRWVLVRRLQLRLSARADASALSRQISARWAELAASAEPGETASPHASAVWFADEPAARLAWLQRGLEGQPCTAWFWAQVMAEEGQGAALAEQAHAPWRTPVPPTRDAAFAEQVAALLAGAGSGPAVGTDWPAPARAAPAANPVALAAQATPASAPAGRQPQPTRAAARRPAPEGPSAGLAPGTVPGAPSDVQPSVMQTRKLPSLPVEAAPSAPGTAAAEGRRSTATSPPAASEVPAPTGAGQQAATAPPAPAALALLDPGLRTAWGGFFFVLALWRQTPPPDAGTATAWLQALAAWLRLPSDDGIAVWLARLGRASDQPQPALPLRALRLQALYLSRLPLRRLLASPALLRANATHVDLHLPLRGVRLAVRRAGLDLDPGWQPLLARAIHFHYEAR